MYLKKFEEWNLDLVIVICSGPSICRVVPWRPGPLVGRLKLLRLATTKLALHTTQGRCLVTHRGTATTGASPEARMGSEPLGSVVPGTRALVAGLRSASWFNLALFFTSGLVCGLGWILSWC